MAEVKWIKIVTGIFDDEKIQLIEQMPDGDTILVIWFKLLCLAGKTNNRGIIMLSDKIPYTDEMLSAVFRRPINTVRLALKAFEAYGMVEIVDGTVTITNWEKHQSGAKLESIREYNRLAKQAERDRKKLLLCQGHVNESHDTDIDIDKDIDKDKRNKGRIVPDKPAHRAQKFSSPSLEDVKAYCTERGKGVDPERWYDHYQSNGWMVGKTKMKDWKAAVRTWERNEYDAGRSANNAGNHGARPGKRAEEVPTYGKVY